MINADKLKRSIAFYTAVALFIILLPIMLSYALGYKIDFRKLKIYKTGILYIASSPTGAEIYINGKKHTDLTPARIEELKPGAYKVEVKREGFNLWEKELLVRPNMVTKADHIILFPVIQDIKMVARYPVNEFAVSGKNFIYYMTPFGLYKSGMDGSSLKRISPFSNWPKDIAGRKFSADGSRMLFFTDKKIFVIYLDLDKAMTEDGEAAKIEEILISEHSIADIFWYSDKEYIIVVTKKSVDVVELEGEGERNIVLLYKFDSEPGNLYYDDANDSLYFTDTGKEDGRREERYLYRLDLRKNFLQKLMQLFLKKEKSTPDERK